MLYLVCPKSNTEVNLVTAVYEHILMLFASFMHLKVTFASEGCLQPTFLTKKVFINDSKWQA